jgi:nicotinamidase-related amidase
MSHTPLPIPEHFDRTKVGQVWRVPYEQRAVEAEAWGKTHNLKPAREDKLRVCLVAVDVQNTFCIPEFELYVGGRSGTGAVDDNTRLCEFVYRNLDVITQIIPTMDTHEAMQIFHGIFLINDQGQHPAPYSLISAEDVAQGKWRFNAAIADELGKESSYVQRHLEHYTRVLERGDKYALTIWPYHAMLGGIGHALVSAFEEATFFHGFARCSQPSFEMKGSNPLTEHYSVLGPEVLTGPDKDTIAHKNLGLISKLLLFDAIIIGGQAKSHCVAWTIQDLLDGIEERDSHLARKVYLLEDCASPVVVPGSIDYTVQAEAAYKKFATAGMHIVKSTEPISDWLDIS